MQAGLFDKVRHASGRGGSTDTALSHAALSAAPSPAPNKTKPAPVTDPQLLTGLPGGRTIDAPLPQPLPVTALEAVPPKPLPTLPAANMPTLPPTSDRGVLTQELGNLFWGGIHSALQPAALDEQWMAVRRLLTVS